MRYLGTVTAVAIATVGAGCASTPAVIADLEEDKVIVQKGLGTSDHEILAKAKEGCALHGRIPIPLSKVCLDQYCFEENHLFACVPKQ